MKFLISGAGIAGLSAAIMLRMNGHDVEIFEKTEKISPYGAGLQLSPNGMKVLQFLKVNLHNAVFPERLEMCKGRTGETIFSLPINPKAQEKWGAPYATVHRADLHHALFERLEKIGGVKWHFGKTSDKFTLSPQGASLHNQEGDYLIIADGVHSELAKQIYPNSQNRHSGFIAYRGVAPYNPQIFSVPTHSIIWAENGKHAVTTRISNGEAMNFVAIIPSKQWEKDNWRDFAPNSELLPHFENWRIAPLIEQCENLGKWALIVRENYPSLYQGRAILIGDAAHPMLPTLAQGAVQALEDVAALALCLSQNQLNTEQFQNLRARRIRAIQSASKTALMRYHRPRFIQEAQWLAAKAANKIAPSLLERELDWIYRG